MDNLSRGATDYRTWWHENTSVPFGSCWCGCGGKTREARQTYARHGYVKGEPVRYITGHHTRKYQLDHHFFDQIDSERKAYWLGLISADGCITDNGTLVISLARRDEDHLRLFRQHLQAEHPIRRYDNEYGEMSTLAIKSFRLAEGLTANNITPRKTETLKWPTTVPIELLRHYLRGYSDGDGSWHTEQSQFLRQDGTRATKLCWSLTGNQAFCMAAQRFIVENARVNQNKLHQHHKAKSIYAIRYADLQASRVFHLLYDDSTVSMSRKHDIAAPHIRSERNKRALPDRQALTDDDVREIRRLRGKVSQRELAKQFGIAQNTISRVQTGKRRTLVT